MFIVAVSPHCPFLSQKKQTNLVHKKDGETKPTVVSPSSDGPWPSMEDIMKKLMFVFVLMAGCMSTNDPIDPMCKFEWMGPEVLTTCESRLEISSRYLVFWTTTEDDHLIVVSARGRFPKDLEEPIDVIHLAVVTPDGDDYWCSTENSPMQCGVSIEIWDNRHATVTVKAYVSRDQEGWRYIRMSTEVDIAWMEEE